MPSCAVSTCRITHRNKAKIAAESSQVIYMHTFPKDETIQKKWIQLCKRQNALNLKSAVMCSLHFQKEDYQRNLQAELLGYEAKQVLKWDAIPSLNLPEDEIPPKLEYLECILCCGTFNDDSSSEDDNDVFKEFCVRFLPSKIELENDSALCPRCVLELSSVLEMKIKVEETECRVRSLQLSILRELRGLQGKLSDLEEQFKGIEDFARNGLENCPGNDGTEFRRQILTVSKDLRSFQTVLTEQFSPVIPTTPLADPVVKTETDELPIPEEMISSSVLTDGFFHSLAPSEPQMPKKASKTFSSRRKLEKERFKQNIKKFSETFISLSSPVPSPTPSSPSEDEEYLFDPLGDDCKEKESEEDYEPPNEGRKRRACSSKTISKIRRVLNDGVDTDLLNTELEDGAQCSEDEEGEDNNKSSKSKPKRSQERKKTRIVPDLPDPLEKVDFTGMSPFKKYTLTILLQRHIVGIYEEDQKGLIPNTPEYQIQKLIDEKKMTFFDYNAERSTVHLKGIEVKINEEAKTVECLHCPKTLEIGWPVKSVSTLKKRKNKFKTHLFTHMTGYLCEFCPPYKDTKRPPHQRTFLGHIDHLKQHKSELPFVCHLCGKSWTNSCLLKRHISTHKPIEERKKSEEEKPPGEFLCEFCPKSCDSKRSLRQHVLKAHPQHFVKKDEMIEGKKQRQKGDFIPLHRKLQILEFHLTHPNYSFKTLQKRFYELKFPSYLQKWKNLYQEQVLTKTNQSGSSNSFFFDKDLKTEEKLDEKDANPIT